MENTSVFIPTKLNISIDVSQIVSLHYFKYSKHFTFGGEKHDFWEVVYVDQGEIGAAADNKGVDLRQGEAIFHKPNEYHNIWAKNQFANVIVFSFICSSPAMVFFENKIMSFNSEQKSLLAKILDAGKICFKGPLDDVYQTKLNMAEYQPFASEQVIKNYIELLLISLVQSSAVFSTKSRATSSAKLSREDIIVESIEQMLSENLYNEISLSDVLQKVCFSKSYLTRLFREHTNCSIMEYYTNLKIAEAQKMISEGELSFSQISEKLAFGSIHYFSYLFKKKTLMTPSEYRRSVQSRSVL